MSGSLGGGNGKGCRPQWVIFRARRALWVLDADELLDRLPPALLAVALQRGKRWLGRRRYALPGPSPVLDRILPPLRHRKRANSTDALPGPNPQGPTSG